MAADPGLPWSQAAEEPGMAEDAHAESLLEGLDDLAEDVTTTDAREQIQETRDTIALAGTRGLLRSRVRRLDPGDAAQAFVGSVVFAAPLLVEDGVFDIAQHLFTTTVAGVPVFLIANTAFVVLMTHALLSWTGQDQVESHEILGVIPVRLLMILGVSFLVAALLMTVWGRVGDWQPPAEAIARINVLWTVGALGAGLGDIISEGPGDRGDRVKDDSSGASEPVTDAELLSSLHSQLASLESTVENEARREAVTELRMQAQDAATGDRFGRSIRKYTTRDIAEAFVGSIFFSIPFLVEDGVFDVAAYFLAVRLGGVPVFFVLNAVFVLLMIAALVYWAGPQAVTVSRPLLGVLPRRLVGIAVVSFLTAGALMTMWGRVEWGTPVIAIARISAVWTVASFGAALGDILPGESSGADINDELADLVDFGDE